MTQELTLNGRRILAVDVPEGSYGHDVFIETTGVPMMDFYFPSGPVCKRDHYGDIQLPEGQWQPLGFADQISEEQAQKIVYRWDSGKWNDYYYHLATVDTALESFRSWLRMNNLSKQYLLIDKK